MNRDAAQDYPDEPQAEESSTWPDRDRRDDGKPENARPRDRFGRPLPRGAVDEMADRVEPEDVCTDVADAVRRAQSLWDEQRYFEAHEFFEWAWKGPVTPDDDRPFFKGMAQIAVGFTHVQRGNDVGADRLLERGLGQVAGYGSIHAGIDVEATAADARAGREALAVGAEVPLPNARRS